MGSQKLFSKTWARIRAAPPNVQRVEENEEYKKKQFTVQRFCTEN
jgi:hypothetical protein